MINSTTQIEADPNPSRKKDPSSCSTPHNDKGNQNQVTFISQIVLVPQLQPQSPTNDPP